MNIGHCNGDFDCHSQWELENFIIKSSLNPFDDIWLRKDRNYSSLAILVNGNNACVHYFLNEKEDIWKSVGYGNKNVAFLIYGNESQIPADSVILLNKAVECAKQF